MENMQFKSSVLFLEKILGFILSDRCFLLHLQSFHEPAKALVIHEPQICFCPRPLKTPVGKPLVKQDITVSGPIEGFDSVGPPTAEQEQAFFIHGLSILLCHNGRQALDSESEVCITAGNVVVAHFAQVNHFAGWT